ncbi:hypothetical protein E3355_23105 [Salmonella enterica subsp. enterica serovar Chester]|nr:hypothetical protein [Salmonella enterica subsp. enterica serovar Chester]EFJ8055315.1 hypothetical protein [Escherichia coli]HAS1519135.1 hypothetical protein [Enterobacter hormaechei]
MSLQVSHYNMLRASHEGSQKVVVRTVITVRFVPDIVIHTLRVTLLSDSGYALIGYEYCARIM